MNKDKDFMVEVTKPDGTTKEMFYSTIIGVVIERNDDAKAVMKIFEAADRIKAGFEVDGNDINMKGYLFKRKSN